ncbi:hypothetical protein F4212_12330 [Candidatus Poribacteria bacterium]|nr:hypothetical protein [Candidatus Poribacteria bacterium]
MSNKRDCERILREWFKTRTNKKVACFVWSLREIAADAGVSVTAVQQHLPKILSGYYSEINSHSDFRKARKYFAAEHRTIGNAIPAKDIARIKRLRKNYTIFETADKTGYSPGTVQKYSSKKSTHRT